MDEARINNEITEWKSKLTAFVDSQPTANARFELEKYWRPLRAADCIGSILSQTDNLTAVSRGKLDEITDATQKNPECPEGAAGVQ